MILQIEDYWRGWLFGFFFGISIPLILKALWGWYKEFRKDIKDQRKNNEQKKI